MTRQRWFLMVGGAGLLAGCLATTRGKPRGLLHRLRSMFGLTTPRRRVNRTLDRYDWPQDDAQGWSDWSERQERAA